MHIVHYQIISDDVGNLNCTKTCREFEHGYEVVVAISIARWVEQKFSGAKDGVLEPG